MEAKVIIVSSVKSNKSDNKVWAVAITGEQQPQAHCKSAYKAMRFAFLRCCSDTLPIRIRSISLCR